MVLHFAALITIFCFQAPVGNAIPFMYYRSDLACKVDGEWQDCTEDEACQNDYEYKFINKNGIESISMDYGLICEKRLTEASIIALGFLGQLAAYIVAIITEVPRNKKTLILFLCLFFEGLLLFSLSFIRGSIIYVTFVNVSYNFFFSYLYSQIFAYSNEMYSTEIKERSVSLINIMWTSGGLIFAVYSQFYGDWIYQISYFGGITVLTLSIPFFILRPTTLELNLTSLLEKARKSDKLEAQEQQKNFIEDLVNKFQELKKNKKYLINSVIFILSWTVIQVSYSTPLIAFNSIGGDIQTNVFISILVDFLGSFVAHFLLSRYDPLRLFLNNLLLIGVLQTVSICFPTNCYFLQLFVILGTKLSTRVAFPTLITLLNLIVPYRFSQLVFNIANVFAILFVTVLPYYRFIMDQLHINIFFGVGLLTIAHLFLSRKFKTLEDENPDLKTKRLSRDLRKRSSFAPMKRNSDAIFDQMVGSSSMIADKAGMIIDKQFDTDEKRLANLFQGTELACIQEY